MSLLAIISFLSTFSSFFYAAFSKAPSGPWDQFNYAPADRSVWPVAVHSTHGFVQSPGNLLGIKEKTILSGYGSWIALDFGKEVGGLISMNIEQKLNDATLSLSFTESPMFINPLSSDDSTYPSPNMSYDGVLTVNAPLSSELWTQPTARLRGGFRYLTIVSNVDDETIISNVSCSISFMPHFDDLRNYSGYFYAPDPESSDENFLTKAWYAGAYTVQTNTVSLHSGREVPFVSSPGWENNATLGIAGPIIVDGAKRDRAVWPGDMGIAVPTQFVSTNDLLPTRNALSTMFSMIDPITGALPESGPPLSQKGSDTYHAWTLIGTHNYFYYSGDIDWLTTVWSNYTKAVKFLENKSIASGLINITGLRDWARLGGGGVNSEGNALYYKVLTNSADLASYINDSELSIAWTTNASNVKQSFNDFFWYPELGLYRDNDTTALCPQDGNSFAVSFNLTQSDNQASLISAGLQKNWNDLGPVSPELPGTITPFISGFELQAHFLTGNDDRAMDLLRREWGYMLTTNLSVQSTWLEGFQSNGSIGYRSYDGYNYDASYTSHSHGWSSGPTSALTFYVLGLQITAPQGKLWSVSPHLSRLNAAEGGFETSLGWFGVKWTLSRNLFYLSVSSPLATQGEVLLPLLQPQRGIVLVNGVPVSWSQKMKIALGGGNHNITVI